MDEAKEGTFKALAILVIKKENMFKLFKIFSKQLPPIKQNEEMTVCRICGSILSANYVFCNKCGVKM
ncbi:MAG: hypothetical protein ACFFB0_06250 [Promethearchaeota archaeon]